MDPMLREAAQTGNIAALYTLTEGNPHVLEGMEEIPFTETPLHVAAARGHTEFAMLVLSLKPSFGRKLNQNWKSPMHLALENGQTQMVRWLLKAEKGLVRVKGRDGKTPLHCAVELGEIDILVESLTNCPECIRDVTAKGETCLHIAAKETTTALEVLVGWLKRYCHKDAGKLEDEILNAADMKGNTPLHVAAYENQQQALKLLLECRSIKKNTKNFEGLTAMEIIEQRSQSGLENIGYFLGTQQRLQTSNCFNLQRKNEKSQSERLCSKMSRSEQLMTSLIRRRLNVTKEISNAMLVASALIVTITFQGVLSPPGGVLQASVDNNNAPSTICGIKCNNSATSPACSIIFGNNNTTTTDVRNTTTSKGQSPPGQSVMEPWKFLVYWIGNSLAFLFAVGVTQCLLPRSLLGLAVSIAFCFLFYSYAISVIVISPYPALGGITWVILPTVYSFLTFCNAFSWRSQL